MKDWIPNFQTFSHIFLQPKQSVFPSIAKDM